MAQARHFVREKPYSATVYLAALDHEQHGKGPDTAAARAELNGKKTVIDLPCACPIGQLPQLRSKRIWWG